MSDDLKGLIELGWFGDMPEEDSMPTPPDPLDLDAIQKRCDAATKGPWIEGQDGIYGPGGDYENSGLLAVVCKGRGNTTFIAHARTDIPALLQRLREVEAELGDWKRGAKRRLEFLEAARDFFKDECKRLEQHLATARTALKKAVAWHGLDGDGITDPTLSELKHALAALTDAG